MCVCVIFFKSVMQYAPTYEYTKFEASILFFIHEIKCKIIIVYPWCLYTTTRALQSTVITTNTIH